MTALIDKDMKLSQVVKKYPATYDIFLKHGMPKYEGPLPTETLLFFSRMHGVDIKQLLDELNEMAGSV
ncbi:MAG: DUF1858 domain-containing protein [Methanosarcinales archaeon]|nr:DUF1858 domain-containing protein [Methanosarcinales archaeon]